MSHAHESRPHPSISSLKIVGGKSTRAQATGSGMVTSLAAQLAALRPSATQTVQSDAGGLKQRPSLLFSPSEAADLDSEAIQSIGLSGLAELEKHDPALRKYEKLLLARTSAEFRREIQSSEVGPSSKGMLLPDRGRLTRHAAAGSQVAESVNPGTAEGADALLPAATLPQST